MAEVASDDDISRSEDKDETLTEMQKRVRSRGLDREKPTKMTCSLLTSLARCFAIGCRIKC